MRLCLEQYSYKHRLVIKLFVGFDCHLIAGKCVQRGLHLSTTKAALMCTDMHRKESQSHLVWVVVMKVPDHVLCFVSIDGVAAVHAELGKFKLLAAKLGQRAAAPSPSWVAHFQCV